MRQEREEMEALRKDPLQFDPDAEARKRLAETKAALTGQPSRPAAAGAAGGGVPEVIVYLLCVRLVACVCQECMQAASLSLCLFLSPCLSFSLRPVSLSV